MALELRLLLLLRVATLLLLEGDLLTVALLFELRVVGLLATDLCVLVVLLRTFLLWVLFSGFLYDLVLLVTVLLLGVWVTDLLVTVFRLGDLTVVDLLFTALRCGDRTVVDLFVIVLSLDGLASFLRTDLLSIFFDLSAAVLPATFPLERLDRIPLFFTASPLLVFDLYDLYESLFRATLLLLRES